MKTVAVVIFVLLLASAFNICNMQIGDDEVFILPDGYRGVVFILYNQPNGNPVKYELEKRVYEIPSNGILKTQFSFNVGWHHFGKYFYKQGDKLVEIPFVLDNEIVGTGSLVGPDTVYACCVSTGKSYYNNGTGFVEFEKFYIGTKEEISKASKEAEKIHIVDLVN
jgi:hypothetical protein